MRSMDSLEVAKEVLRIEAQAVERLIAYIDSEFEQIIACILAISGRVVLSGMGKSGHIGVKIAATLASTGTPSFFMHPAEALHGDLGMLTPNDIVIAISNSGESEEMVRLVSALKQRNIVLIAMCGNASATLVKEADFFLNIAVEKEACPLQLAPTASTTATLAMGDALAVALMQARGFKSEDFAQFHPGGSLGRKLLTKVSDVMHSAQLPIVQETSKFDEVVTAMSSGRLGLCIVKEQMDVVGIITDGDLRRAIQERTDSFYLLSAQEMMTHAPKTIAADAMAYEAEQYMLEHKIKELLVMEQKQLLGVVQLYDLGAV